MLQPLRHFITSFTLLFFLLKECEKKQIKEINTDWQLQYRESYWVHVDISLRFYLFEILEGCLCLAVCALCGSLMGGVQSARPLRPSERQVLSCLFSLSFCAAVVTPDILVRADTLHNTLLFVSRLRHYVSHLVCVSVCANDHVLAPNLSCVLGSLLS